jgi:hypothetical protein
MSSTALLLMALCDLPKPHGGLVRYLQRGVAADLIGADLADETGAARVIERQRIADHARGWNDAARGRQPRSPSIGYALGYADWSR